LADANQSLSKMLFYFLFLQVHTPPKFEEMSKVIELVEGKVASIICNATGKPKPGFQWIRDKDREDLSKKSR